MANFAINFITKIIHAENTLFSAIYGVSDGIQTNFSARSIKGEAVEDNKFHYINPIKPKLSTDVYEKCCALGPEKRKILCNKLDQEVEMFNIEREIEYTRKHLTTLDTALKLFYPKK